LSLDAKFSISAGVVTIAWVDADGSMAAGGGEIGDIVLTIDDEPADVVIQAASAFSSLGNRL
jgi:hypothetical protein